MCCYEQLLQIYMSITKKPANKQHTYSLVRSTNQVLLLRFAEFAIKTKSVVDTTSKNTNFKLQLSSKLHTNISTSQYWNG